MLRARSVEVLVERPRELNLLLRLQDDPDDVVAADIVNVLGRGRLDSQSVLA